MARLCTQLNMFDDAGKQTYIVSFRELFVFFKHCFFVCSLLAKELKQCVSKSNEWNEIDTLIRNHESKQKQVTEMDRLRKENEDLKVQLALNAVKKSSVKPLAPEAKEQQLHQQPQQQQHHHQQILSKTNMVLPPPVLYGGSGTVGVAGVGGYPYYVQPVSYTLLQTQPQTK